MEREGRYFVAQQAPWACARGPADASASVERATCGPGDSDTLMRGSPRRLTALSSLWGRTKLLRPPSMWTRLQLFLPVAAALVARTPSPQPKRTADATPLPASGRDWAVEALAATTVVTEEVLRATGAVRDTDERKTVELVAETYRDSAVILGGLAFVAQVLAGVVKATVRKLHESHPWNTLGTRVTESHSSSRWQVTVGVCSPVVKTLGVTTSVLAAAAPGKKKEPEEKSRTGLGRWPRRVLPARVQAWLPLQDPAGGAASLPRVTKPRRAKRVVVYGLCGGAIGATVPSMLWAALQPIAPAIRTKAAVVVLLVLGPLSARAAARGASLRREPATSELLAVDKEPEPVLQPA